MKKSGRIRIFIFGIVLVSALVIGAFYFGIHRQQPGDTQKMDGTVALSESGLRDVVNRQHLTVYWTGSVTGDQYTLFVPKTGVAVVRYIPAGESVTNASPDFRLIATYVQKDAFATTQAGGLKPGNLGFINIDGNSVFYAKSRPTNAYVGLKGKDVQLEIFDPGQDQALALALFKGQIQPIK